MTAQADRRTEPAFAPAGTATAVGVVVLAHGDPAHLDRLLRSLRREAAGTPMRVVAVGGGDGLRGHPDVASVAAPPGPGRAGRVNAGCAAVGEADAVLVLDSDAVVEHGTVAALRAGLRRAQVGVVLPLLLAEDGRVVRSLRRDPTAARVLGDAVLRDRLGDRPAWLAAAVRHPVAYAWAHPVDWGTGTAMLVRASVLRAVGPWDDRAAPRTEEAEFCRRVRAAGWEVWFEPGARLRVVGAPARRRAQPAPAPPRAAEPPPDPAGVRGTVVVPAHDEAAVLPRLLGPLAPWARAAGVDVLVVCNGCTDATAEVARGFGVRVLDLPEPSKAAALAAGDAAATGFPRLYVDADVRVGPAAVAATLRALDDGRWLAARPAAAVDVTGATAPVRAYHRVRARLPSARAALWGAGVYGLSERGHARLGAFPDLVADDLWVDTLFSPAEKVVVPAPPVLVHGPRTTASLLRVLHRTYRGNAQVRAGTGTSSTARTARELAGTVRGPRTAADAAVYAVLVLLGRVRRRDRAGTRWERDESTRR
ncbi:glycosyltransferase [Cellulomonas hominis]|uniref:glycosyltransferase n=1 Tax=Cellulomonas hominis TaxID=156981 RepID=UPI001C112B63|nr:glycosyltransferase [Cellulomonas hominis]MBU5424222.1 glycosyltransferase [Cellulomonas hominis]